MRAVRFDGTNVVLNDSTPEPTVGAGESLVAIRVASPDATDLAIARQEVVFTGTLGRRFIGTVIEPGDDERHAAAKGTRVVAEVNGYVITAEALEREYLQNIASFSDEPTPDQARLLRLQILGHLFPVNLF